MTVTHKIRGRGLMRGVFLFASAACLLSCLGCQTLRENWSGSSNENWAAGAQAFSQGMSQQPQQPLIWGGSVSPQTQTCHVSPIGGGYYRTACQ